MNFNDPSLWDFLVWCFWFFIWITAITIWFRCVFDVFGDHTLSGWGKAGWVVVLIFLPWLGALIYLIARGRSMNERRVAQLTQARSAQEHYIRQVAATGSGPAEQIAEAKTLLDAGTITQAEFDALKAKALA